jgi:hypothetical protein
MNLLSSNVSSFRKKLVGSTIRTLEATCGYKGFTLLYPADFLGEAFGRTTLMFLTALGAACLDLTIFFDDVISSFNSFLFKVSLYVFCTFLG